MHYTDPLTVEKLAAQYVHGAQDQARSLSLLHQVGLKEEKNFSDRGHRLLHHMGRQLVVLGEWLEQYSSPQHSY